MSEQEGVGTEITGDELPTRWEIELEFVQSLANIQYVNYLAQNSYFNEPEFLNYLKYLNYWKNPEYAKYLVYPNCLHILTLLQTEEFRKNIVNPEFMNMVMNDMVKRWQDPDKDSQAPGDPQGQGPEKALEQTLEQPQAPGQVEGQGNQPQTISSQNNGKSNLPQIQEPPEHSLDPSETLDPSEIPSVPNTVNINQTTMDDTMITASGSSPNLLGDPPISTQAQNEDGDMIVDGINGS